MKKIIFILCMLVCLCLTSCSGCGSCGEESKQFNNYDYGKIDYYVAGVYIRVDNEIEMTLNDANPKVYFNFTKGNDFGMFTQRTGYDKSAVQFGTGQKSVSTKEGREIYYALSRMTIVNPDVESVSLYPIYVNSSNTLEIDTDLFDTIDIENGYTYKYNVKFENDEILYGLDLRLVFNKK